MGAEKIENQNRQKSILVEFGFWSLSKRSDFQKCDFCDSSGLVLIFKKHIQNTLSKTCQIDHFYPRP